MGFDIWEEWGVSEREKHTLLIVCTFRVDYRGNESLEVPQHRSEYHLRHACGGGRPAAACSCAADGDRSLE